MPDKIPVCPTESVVSAPEKNFSDEDVNSLDSCRKDKTQPMLAGGSVNNEGASAGRRLRCARKTAREGWEPRSCSRVLGRHLAVLLPRAPALDLSLMLRG